VCISFFCFFSVCHSNISGMAEQICAKFTGKTCLVPHSDKFEFQGLRSKVKVTGDIKRKTAESCCSRWDQYLRNYRTDLHKFTGKMCLVPRSDESECQGQRSKVKVTRNKKHAVRTHHRQQRQNGMHSLQITSSTSW